MGKIKSALELAMEKTEHLKDIKKGKEDAQYQQYVNAAYALARSFLKGEVEKEQVEERIKRYPQNAQGAAVKAFLQGVSQGISFKNCLYVIEVIQALRGEDSKTRKACEELKGLYGHYRQKLDHRQRQLQENVTKIQLKKLQKAGISGTAIDGFNINNLDQWKDISSQIEQEFAEVLQHFKKILL